MIPMQRALSRRGFRVLNLGYRSRSSDVATLAASVAQRIIEWSAREPTHVVAHSLGGILLRCAMLDEMIAPAGIRRVVMLGPPNAGTELADRLPEIPVFGRVYRRMTGPVGRQLGTGPDGIAAHLPAVPFELGVIAGTRSVNPFFSSILNGPSDGKVTVERTKVEGMTAFITVPQYHTILMRDPVVIEHTIAFLESGSFRAPAE
jgi:hypothetical protein